MENENIKDVIKDLEDFIKDKDIEVCKNEVFNIKNEINNGKDKIKRIDEYCVDNLTKRKIKSYDICVEDLITKSNEYENRLNEVVDKISEIQVEYDDRKEKFEKYGKQIKMSDSKLYDFLKKSFKDGGTIEKKIEKIKSTLQSFGKGDGCEDYEYKKINEYQTYLLNGRNALIGENNS